MDRQPEAQAEVRQVVQTLLEGVRPILGGNFVGAYLQGSWAVGDADDHSDVDFVFVVNEPVPEALVAPLQAEHVRAYDLDTNWARHLEGSYFPRAWLRDRGAVGRPLLYVDNGSRVLERSPHDNTLVVRWVLREHGVTLAGPEPAELLDSVPAGALRQEVFTTIQAWAREIFADPQAMNNGWYQPYAVLSYCRMLQTLATGRVHSKPSGAAWARRALEPRWTPLVERALAAHSGQWLRVAQPADPADFEATQEFVRYALAVSRRLFNTDEIETPA